MDHSASLVNSMWCAFAPGKEAWKRQGNFYTSDELRAMDEIDEITLTRPLDDVLSADCRKVDWEQIKRCLAEIDQTAKDFLRQALLIGGAGLGLQFNRATRVIAQTDFHGAAREHLAHDG